MDRFSQYSHPHHLEPGSNFLENPGTPSISEGSSTSLRRAAHSDGEVILASARPKRRAGRRVFKETRHPVYRGVRRRNSNKWVCELREPNKKTRIWLGTYPTAEMAARAHDVAALALRGKTACLNFEDSSWKLPRPASLNAADIRRAAAEAAEEFRPREDCGRGEEVRKEAENAESSVFYIDEEAIFDMPGLLVNMAEGLLMSPPPPSSEEAVAGDEADSFSDVSLWSFSI